MGSVRRFYMVTALFLLIGTAMASDTPIHLFQDPESIGNDIQIQRLSDTVWRHISYIFMPEYGKVPANGLIVTQDDAAVLIDTPWSDEQTAELFTWAKEHLACNIQAVIVTHSHDDCLGGLAEAHRLGATSYALQTTLELARASGKEVPRHGWSDSLHLPAELPFLELRYLGAGHTVDNIVVWHEKEQMLFGGCLIKSLASRSLGYTKEAVLQDWPNTIRKVSQTYAGARVVIPGHGAPGGPELMQHTLDILKEKTSRQ